MTMYGGYPMKTVHIDGEPIEVPDWDAIHAPERAALTKMAERIGYGRCIQILEHLWTSKELKRGVPEKSALMASGTVCVWCEIDSRTGKKYRKPRSQSDTAGEPK